MKRDLRYSIVVPCYNSGEWIGELAERITAAMRPWEGAYEILLINDRSPKPDTWPAIVRTAAEFPAVRGINMLYNVGQFRATLCGLEQARGEFVITIDDDFQHPPEELPKLIGAMAGHPEMDCVIGAYISKQHSFVRNAGSKLMQKISSFLYHKESGITTTSFRIMPRRFARTLTLYRVSSPQLGPLIVSLSKKVMNVPVEHAARQYGRSGYSMLRCVRETFKSIVNASIFPLRLLTLTGTFFALVAFFIAIFYFVQWVIFSSKVPGYTSLILAICFFSGLTLLGVGMLGEYIGRIIHEVTGLPAYTIADDTDAGKKEGE